MARGRVRPCVGASRHLPRGEPCRSLSLTEARYVCIMAMGFRGAARMGGSSVRCCSRKFSRQPGVVRRGKRKKMVQLSIDVLENEAVTRSRGNLRQADDVYTILKISALQFSIRSRDSLNENRYKNEGKSLDVIENKRSKSVTFWAVPISMKIRRLYFAMALCLDVIENKCLV